jgi:hypothetical protein
MTELEVSLDFACHNCCHPVGVTVRCAGAMLTLTTKVLANVVVPCPNCGDLIDVTFDPDGTVHAVAPHEAPRLPEPSVN